MKMKAWLSKTSEMQQKQFCFYRDVYSNTSLPQETRKTSNNLTLYLKQLEKEEQTKPRETQNSQSNLEKKTVELEESGSLISDYSTKL